MEENNKLIINSKQSNLLNELKKNLKECEWFYFSVAFISFSGLQLLLDTLKELESRDIKGKIITTTYLNFTEPKALEKLQEFENIDLKVFIANKEIGFLSLIHISMIVLGFLSYNDGYLKIPNKELMIEFEKALRDKSFVYCCF